MGSSDPDLSILLQLLLSSLSLSLSSIPRQAKLAQELANPRVGSFTECGWCHEKHTPLNQLRLDACSLLFFFPREKSVLVSSNRKLERKVKELTIQIDDERQHVNDQKDQVSGRNYQSLWRLSSCCSWQRGGSRRARSVRKWHQYSWLRHLLSASSKHNVQKENSSFEKGWMK